MASACEKFPVPLLVSVSKSDLITENVYNITAAWNRDITLHNYRVGLVVT